MMKSTLERLIEVVEELLEEGAVPASGRQVLSPDVPLDAVAGDSIARMMLLEAVEGEFALRLAEGKLRGLRTLGELASLLDREIAGP